MIKKVWISFIRPFIRHAGKPGKMYRQVMAATLTIGKKDQIDELLSYLK